MKTAQATRAFCASALTLLLGACSLAPPLKTPEIPAGDSYKELGPWTPAQPADRVPRDRSALSRSVTRVKLGRGLLDHGVED